MASFLSSIFDTPAKLVALLGSWWSDDFAAVDQMDGVVAGMCLVMQQAAADQQQLDAAASRRTINTYRTENWYKLELLASERSVSAAGVSFLCDTKISDIATITNGFTAPSVFFQPVADFTIASGVITFREDPFNDPRIVRQPVYKDGEVADEQLLLWGFRASLSHKDVFQQYGYVLSRLQGDGDDYKRLINAGWDGLAGGNSTLSVKQAIAAMSCRPVVKSATETVVDIARMDDAAGQEYLLVITDVEVYRFPATDCPTVAVGDTVRSGGTLTDGLMFHETNRGTIPDWLTSLTLGRGWLPTCIRGELTFRDEDVEIVVDESHESGFTKVSWPLTGSTGDVSGFFEEMHARGVAAAVPAGDNCDGVRTITYPAIDCDDETVILKAGTIAHWLDIRAESVGEPTASHLPETINPLRFLISNVLRGSLLLAKIKTQPGCDLLQYSRILRLLTPAHTAAMLLIDTDGVLTYVDSASA